MAKKEYDAAGYEAMLSWAMKPYIQTQSDIKRNYTRMKLMNPLPNGLSGEAWVDIMYGGLLTFRFEAALGQEAEEDGRIYKKLNGLNKFGGVTLYVDRDTFGAKMCARQELYMDHFTMAAAKRAAQRIMAAVSDTGCALKALSDEMSEYFGADAMECAAAERAKEIREWDDDFEQELLDEYAEGDEIIILEDDEELPF